MRMVGGILALLTMSGAALAAPRHAGNNRTQIGARREGGMRVIHGSGGGWATEDDVRMMQPYWDAQNAGGTLLIIRAASGPLPGAGESEDYVDEATAEIVRKLQLVFEEVGAPALPLLGLTRLSHPPHLQPSWPPAVEAASSPARLSCCRCRICAGTAGPPHTTRSLSTGSGTPPASTSAAVSAPKRA